MRGIEIARDFAALRRDRKSNFCESVYLSHGRSVVVRSKHERGWWEGFTKGLATGQIDVNKISIRDLFEALMPDGRELVRLFDPRLGPGSGTRELMILEGQGAVTSGDFSNITGQIVYSRLIERLTPEAYPFQALIPNQPTQFDGEKIAGIAGLGDMAQVVAENNDFPLVGFGQDYIETPQTTKRGFIVPVTKEAIFFDRTGRLLQEAGRVGDSLVLNKEKRAIDCIIDENTTTHRYKWLGTSYATYQTTTPWDNVTASNALVDWTDVDNMNQTLNGITDPFTGEPVVVEADTLICTKSLEMTADRIRNATEITVVTPGYATSANPNETRQPNPMRGKYQVVSSRLLASRLATDTDVFYGSPRQYAAYMENWPITVTQAPAGNSDDFNRDIVTKFKCSERGQYAVLQPRVMSKSTVA